MAKAIKTDELQKQIDELTLSWKRALADYQNLERRSQEEKVNTRKLAARELIIRLLPTLDSLNDARKHQKDEEVRPELVEGLELCIQKFEKALKEEGLEEIETDNKNFDPSLMECVEVEEGEEESKVKDTVLTGYRLNGIVIRPAKVKVLKKRINEKEEDLTKNTEGTNDHI